MNAKGGPKGAPVPMTQDATWAADSPEEEPSQGEKPWARLVAINQNFPGCELLEDEVLVGRRQTNKVQVNHVNVSGIHCKIYRNDDVVFICDMSRNGTTVEGKRLRKETRVLEDGSEIVLVPSTKGNKKIGFHIHLTKKKRKITTGPEVKYDIRDEIGSGAFAQVKLCINRSTGEKFAIKIVDKKRFKLKNHSARPDALKSEVRILQQLDHKNIIKIEDVYEDEEKLSIVLELVEGGDLFDSIINHYEANDRGFDEQKAKHIFSQLIDATEYMHEKKVAHRDLKPENILLKDADTVKISDFGLSRSLGEGSYLKTMCGTPMYLAPEVLPNSKEAETKYSFECDLWSLGAILYVMLSGCSPFDESNPNIHILDQVRQGLYDFPTDSFGHVSENAKDLIKKLLTVDPAKRYSLRQVREHNWMRPPKSQSRKRGKRISSKNGTKIRKRFRPASSDDKKEDETSKKTKKF